MEYRAHYSRLIARAKSRHLPGYSEAHHVIPRCLGGTDDGDNLVMLTPEEHYVAHQLLVKIHPGNPRLIFAVHAMLMSGRTKSRSPNKEFGWLRKLNAAAISERRKGVKHTEATRKKMSELASARVRTEEWGRRISESLAGKPKSAEHNAKVSAALKGRPSSRLGAILTDETKQKMREAALKRPRKADSQKVRQLQAQQDKTPEQLAERSARAHKAWITKRAKAQTNLLFPTLKEIP